MARCRYSVSATTPTSSATTATPGACATASSPIPDGRPALTRLAALAAVVLATATSCGGSAPRLALNRDTVAFTSGRDGDFAIFVTDVDGKSRVERLSADPPP